MHTLLCTDSHTSCIQPSQRTVKVELFLLCRVSDLLVSQGARLVDIGGLDQGLTQPCRTLTPAASLPTLWGRGSAPSRPCACTECVDLPEPALRASPASAEAPFSEPRSSSSSTAAVAGSGTSPRGSYVEGCASVQRWGSRV